MKITIAAVGKMRSRPEKLLWDNYLRRINWPLTLYEVEERKPLDTKQLIVREGELLLKAVLPGALIVAVDKSGKTFSSPSLARLFQEWISDNRKYITFIIGGAEGLHNTILKQADLILSMGTLTWPHLLARCMLLEQIYRSQCILTNHPYHR